jgi:hypothetical protein
MQIFFYLLLFIFLIFEVYKIYLFMPLPGSKYFQYSNIFNEIYFLRRWVWAFRLFFSLIILILIPSVFTSFSWGIAFFICLIAGIYIFHYVVSIERFFSEPESLIFKGAKENAVASDKLMIGCFFNGEAKAYPIQFLASHHIIHDIIGGKSIIVTYCAICRSGRIVEPIVNGNVTTFKLSGMKSFNAIMQDSETHSWWQQATGEAIAGKAKGQTLPEVQHSQTTISEWINLYPNSLIMQPDPESLANYEHFQVVENGYVPDHFKTNFDLRKDFSWILGIVVGTTAKAYDWNKLSESKIINDEIEGVPIVLVLAADGKSFFAYQRTDKNDFTLKDDRIISGQSVYNLAGTPFSSEDMPLKKIMAYQEFWHSWKTFHPNTEQF